MMYGFMENTKGSDIYGDDDGSERSHLFPRNA